MTAHALYYFIVKVRKSIRNHFTMIILSFNHILSHDDQRYVKHQTRYNNIIIFIITPVLGQT